MGKRRKRKTWKKLHKWPSLIIAVFIVLWAISGVILNHRFTFSSFDVNRELLPEEHRYKNWNNAAVRNAVILDSNRVLFYGNTGIWEMSHETGEWKDRRKGLPAGADHHKVNILLKNSKGGLWCGTRFGLYVFNDDRWHSVELPHSDRHIVDIIEVRDTMWVMTRSHIWKVPIVNPESMIKKIIPAPAGYDNKVGLFKTLWIIHSGEIYGIAGKLIVDLVAIVFIFLTISGLIYFFFPRMIRKRRKKEKSIKRLANWNKFSIRWHNKLGIWLVIVLLITTCTGMFLRPPLLIIIATAKVGKIPYSKLDNENAWYDQLRRLIYDHDNDKVYLATSGGIYMTDGRMKTAPEYVYPQPPASVMGYNVFHKDDAGRILVGSFSGLFRWEPSSGVIYNYITKEPYLPVPGPAMPISDHMVSGYFKSTEGLEYCFDYNNGVKTLSHDVQFYNMPEVISDARIPLWNFALELHTARLFKPFLGNFYILFIPLFGLACLLVLVSGLALWIRKFSTKPFK